LPSAGPPAEYDADIVTGGGAGFRQYRLLLAAPCSAFFAARQKLLRRIPGRIVGETRDNQGRRGFVLTLQTREQHIRRERATSNICSNQALNALAAAVYLAALGPAGLREVAGLCCRSGLRQGEDYRAGRL